MLGPLPVVSGHDIVVAAEAGEGHFTWACVGVAEDELEGIVTADVLYVRSTGTMASLAAALVGGKALRFDEWLVRRRLEASEGFCHRVICVLLVVARHTLCFVDVVCLFRVAKEAKRKRVRLRSNGLGGLDSRKGHYSSNGSNENYYTKYRSQCSC